MKLFGRQINDTDFWKGYYTLTLFLGLFLIYLEITIYRKTFISIGILLFIVLIIGLFSFILSKKHYKMTYNLNGNFFPLVQNLLSWGFISCYMILATNYYFADSYKTEYTFKIKSKNSLPGYRIASSRQPTVRFAYFNFEKELVFYSSDSELVDQATKIKVVIRKGALGFDILDDYKLANKE
jgi:hypothetical protein